MTSLTIRPAPLPALLPIMRATALDCIERGKPMWPVEYLTPEQLKRLYPNGKGYQGLLEGHPVAVMILVEHDAQLWPEKPADEALYLHKVAVHPDWQGQGLSKMMVQAAIEETRAAGRSWLRLDTVAERQKLRTLYEAQGFVCVREGTIDTGFGGYPAAWYELSV